MTTDDPVQTQLEAYNSHDLEAFLDCYAADAVIRHADGRVLVLMSGREEMRARYAKLFAEHPGVTAEVHTRLRVGEWVVDEERVQLGEEALHVVVGYLVRDGLIRAGVMIRSDL